MLDLADIVTISDDDSNEGTVHLGKMLPSDKSGQIDKNRPKLAVITPATPKKRAWNENARCPLCQVPFSALITDSPGWHMNECLEALEVNRSRQKECPNGRNCDSTIVSHYAKYTHQAIARRESGESFAEEDTSNIPNPMEVVEAVYDAGVVQNIKMNSYSPTKQTPKQGMSKLVKGQAKITTFFASDGPPKASNPNLTDQQMKITSFFNMDRKENSADKSSKVKNELQNVSTNKKPQNTKYNGGVPSNNVNETSKRCPFYKKLPDVPIVVDAFSYGDIPGVFAYFLSHFHSDHYGGLKKSFSHNLYCSKITANLVKLKIGVAASWIRVLSFEEPTVVAGVQVDIIEAFHCPGAVMFCFRYTDGRTILHTGDFRGNNNMQLHPLLKNIHCDILYLDTTYCNPLYEFPTQDAAVDFVIQTARRHQVTQPDVLFVCGAYCIGKEKVFLGLAKALNLKVCASKDKIRVLRCLEDEDISKYLVTDWKSASIHVLSMGELNPVGLKKHLSNYKGSFSNVVAFKPTGWELDKKNGSDLNAIKPKHYGSVAVYGVPYSEHSSFSELRKFVKFIKPTRIIPTVNVGTSKVAEDQRDILQSWQNT